MTSFPYSALRRSPDFEADNIFAHDAADRLILDLAKDDLASTKPASVVTVGDAYGALTLGAIHLGTTNVRVLQDSIVSQQALAANFNHFAKQCFIPGENKYTQTNLSESAFSDAEIILMRLPKDLGYLRMLAQLIQTCANPSVKVFAGGRIKHMSLSMNQVLADSFETVNVSLARQKSRVIIASSPRQNLDSSWQMPLSEVYDSATDLWVCSLPGVFAAGSVDIGTRFLIETLPTISIPKTPGQQVADLGCGSGLLSAAFLRERPESHVIATDASQIATLSAASTIKKNLPWAKETPKASPGTYTIRQDNALSTVPDAVLDIVLLNPPFHSGAARADHMADALIKDAARALKPGGVIITVFNSHLRHRQTLQRLVGPTIQVARNPKFTITRTQKSVGNKPKSASSGSQRALTAPD